MGVLRGRPGYPRRSDASRLKAAAAHHSQSLECNDIEQRRSATLAVAGLACHGPSTCGNRPGAARGRSQTRACRSTVVEAPATFTVLVNEYGAIGGLARHRRPIVSIRPGNQYTHTRTALVADAGAALACSPLDALVRSRSTLITAYDVEVHDLPAADVQEALAQATPPLYGHRHAPERRVGVRVQARGRAWIPGRRAVCRRRPLVRGDRLLASSGSGDACSDRHTTAPRVRVRRPPGAVVDQAGLFRAAVFEPDDAGRIRVALSSKRACTPSREWTLPTADGADTGTGAAGRRDRSANRVCTSWLLPSVRIVLPGCALSGGPRRRRCRRMIVVLRQIGFSSVFDTTYFAGAFMMSPNKSPAASARTPPRG